MGAGMANPRDSNDIAGAAVKENMAIPDPDAPDPRGYVLRA
jgi:hypothetical protein